MSNSLNILFLFFQNQKAVEAEVVVEEEEVVVVAAEEEGVNNHSQKNIK